MSADLAAAIRNVLGDKPARRPQHPGVGCPCAGCVTRDDRLEALAEDRAAAGRGDYAGLMETERAEYRAEMNFNYWEGSE